MSQNRRFLLPLFALIALAIAVIGLTACGYSSDSKETEEGVPLTLGELKFNVTFSRYLNPNDSEDAAYLSGQKPAPDGSNYFGLFFEVQNESNEPQTLPSTLWITDATGKKYDVLPSESLYALEFGGEVEPEEQIPVLDSPAQQGPIEGSVAIFLLPEEVSGSRPLTLHIPGSDGEHGEVKLDL
jgi:hypothetical protein